MCDGSERKEWRTLEEGSRESHAEEVLDTWPNMSEASLSTRSLTNHQSWKALHWTSSRPVGCSLPSTERLPKPAFGPKSALDEIKWKKGWALFRGCPQSTFLLCLLWTLHTSSRVEACSSVQIRSKMRPVEATQPESCKGQRRCLRSAELHSDSSNARARPVSLPSWSKHHFSG